MAEGREKQSPTKIDIEQDQENKTGSFWGTPPGGDEGKSGGGLVGKSGGGGDGGDSGGVLDALAAIDLSPGSSDSDH